MPTLSIEDQIQARIETFAAELSVLVRQAALEAVEGALSGAATGTRAAPGKRKVGRPKGSGKGTRKATRKATRKKRARQSPATIEKLSGQILAYVKANKGSRLEEISRGLGTPSADLKASVKDMLAGGQLRKTGAKRGTKYFVKAK